MRRSASLLLWFASLVFASACGSAATTPSSSSSSGGSGGDPLVTVYWTAAFLTPSGSLMGWVQATASIPGTASATTSLDTGTSRPKAAHSASATLRLSSGASVSLTGAEDNGAWQLSGGGYSLTFTAPVPAIAVPGSKTTANITGPSGLAHATIVIRYASQSVPQLFCGTIGRAGAQTGAGTIVVATGGGYIAGSLADGATSAGFGGTYSAGAIDSAGPWPGGGSVAVAGSTNSSTGALTGFWSTPAASGQWTATTGACK